MAKEYDWEIKRLFGDYNKAKARMAYLERTKSFGKMDEKEEGEYHKLECLVNVVDRVLEMLPKFQQDVISLYYIYHEALYDIAELLHYSYYHCSNSKNEAVDKIAAIFKSVEFESIVAQQFEAQYKRLSEEKSCTDQPTLKD